MFSDDDPLLEQAKAWLHNHPKATWLRNHPEATIIELQRRFGIGYPRAARLMDQLQQRRDWGNQSQIPAKAAVTTKALSQSRVEANDKTEPKINTLEDIMADLNALIAWTQSRRMLRSLSTS